MKARFLILVCLASMGTLPVLAASYTLQTPNTQMVLEATEGQELKMLYYGDKSATLADIEAAGETPYVIGEIVVGDKGVTLTE